MIIHPLRCDAESVPARWFALQSSGGSAEVTCFCRFRLHPDHRLCDHPSRHLRTTWPSYTCIHVSRYPCRRLFEYEASLKHVIQQTWTTTTTTTWSSPTTTTSIKRWRPEPYPQHPPQSQHRHPVSKIRLFHPWSSQPSRRAIHSIIIIIQSTLTGRTRLVHLHYRLNVSSDLYDGVFAVTGSLHTMLWRIQHHQHHQRTRQFHSIGTMIIHIDL